jgi:hypothetical protein
VLLTPGAVGDGRGTNQNDRMAAAGLDAVVLGCALGASVCFAGSAALKHVSAHQVPIMPSLRPSAFGAFVMATLRHPLWLAGIVCDVAGVALQIVALHLGALALVQPLLLTSLIFALLFRGLGERVLRPAEIGWAMAVAGLLAAFILLSHTSTAGYSSSIDRTPAVIAALAGGAGVTMAVTFAMRTPLMSLRAGLLGLAAGSIYAGTAALLKTVSDVATQDLWRIAVSWSTYCLIVLGGLGLLVGQLAFQAGPLAAGLPIAATVDPLLSIVFGVAIFDEPLRLGPGHGVVLALVLVLMCLAVVRLASSAAQRR